MRQRQRVTIWSGCPLHAASTRATPHPIVHSTRADPCALVPSQSLSLQSCAVNLMSRISEAEAGICSILLFLRCLQKRPKAPACFCFRNSQQVCRHSAKLSAHDRTKQKDMQKILSRPRMSLSPPRTQLHNRSYSNIDTHPHKLLRILLTQARAQAVLGRRCAYCPKFQKQL